MKTLIKSNKSRVFGLLICSALLIGCNNKVEKTNVVNTESSTSISTTTSSSTSLEVSNSRDSKAYTSKMTKADKKKYFDGSEVVYEVKYKSDGFKLRTASSKLLWKIKLYEGKVKISDNEENENAYEIKYIGANEAKLVRGDIEIARTYYDLASKTQTIKFKDDSKPEQSQVMSYSLSFLVYAIDEISEDQKLILIKELIEKGR